MIDDHAVLQLNVRSYSDQTRTAILDAIRRIVTAECQASASPKDPDFEFFDRFPPTDNDRVDHRARPRRLRRRLRRLGAATCPCRPRAKTSATSRTRSTSLHATGASAASTPTPTSAAEAAGRIAQDIPVNHSPNFAPVIQPTLDTGTTALVAAALAWLAAT